MKIGDKVVMSARNLNHTKTDPCAYAGMKGIVTDIYEDNAFCLDCGTCTLVVPMNNAYKKPIPGVWIILNGMHVFHERKKVVYPVSKSPKKWFKWFIPQSLLK